MTLRGIFSLVPTVGDMQLVHGSGYSGEFLFCFTVFDNRILKLPILTFAPKLEDSEIGVAKLIMEFRPV